MAIVASTMALPTSLSSLTSERLLQSGRCSTSYARPVRFAIRASNDGRNGIGVIDKATKKEITPENVLRNQEQNESEKKSVFGAVPKSGGTYPRPETGDRSFGILCSSTQVTQKEGAPKARSSHAVAVVEGRYAYVFGGEFEPRVPLDNKLHVFDLERREWTVADAKGDIPSARVGVTMVASGSKFFVFAGRDEKHEELNEFYSYDTKTSEWKLLSAGETSPPHRSYHTLAVDEEGENIYTFGGCGKNGRLNDLWVYNIKAATWTKLPESKFCTPRGGPGLAVVNGVVYVIFGFCGHELTDIHKFDINKETWEELEITGEKPIGRSVFGTSCIGTKILIYGGEVDPSDQGHLGAGSFTDEVLLLDIEKFSFVKPKLDVKCGRHPGARGWYAAAGFGNCMLVYGGNSETNDRLDDMYLLTVKV